MKENTEKKKTLDADGRPPAHQYNMMRGAFQEVLRLAALGSKAELKGRPASKEKDNMLEKHLHCMAFVGSFLNGVHEEYESMDDDA